MADPISFFFYDLETSGLDPKDARIMQFAGRRTDLELNPIGDPINKLIRLSEDIIPDPGAILVTGITPQATIADGISEAEFLKTFSEEAAVPGTIFVGFNSVRFDDEFMRYLHYRNFYDPYEWQWQDGRSKWDVLDVIRMTRALRPDGIKWPFDSSGKASNRLELLTSLNGLDHSNAHDALSDVDATIAVARMVRNKQERLFDFLLSVRDKRKVAELVEAGKPFVYTCGQYPGEFEKTTAVIRICEHPERQASFVYDLRYDPSQYKDSTPQQLADLWKWQKDADAPRLPVTSLKYNRCPAVAPLGVLDSSSQERLNLDMKQIEKNRLALAKIADFEERLCKAWELLESGKEQTTLISTEKDVDGALYAGFFDSQDKQAMRVVRASEPAELSNLGLSFRDSRLEALLPLYKARNYPKSLSDEEYQAWEKFRIQRLVDGGPKSRMAKFSAQLTEAATRKGLTKQQSYILEELQLYAESIMPDISDQ